ncbi:MAG: substrate-binding domain-containing protein [Chitinophagaceae bacterium]|nr:substrate-binding domain-containing protein [Anaerolineae bacterium]
MRHKIFALVIVTALFFGVVAVSSAQNANLTIGLSVPSLEETGFFATLTAEAQNAADAADAQLTILSADDDPAIEADNLAQLIADGVDALLIYPLDAATVIAGVQAANEANIPVLLLGEDVERTESEIEVASLVAADPAAIGELAASYFCENVSEGSTVVALAGISGLEADTELAEDDYRVVALQAELEGLSAVLASDCATITLTAQETATFTNEDSTAFLSNALGSNVGGVFAPNGELALSTIRAARAARLLSSIKILAAEVTPETLGAIESNRLAGIVSATPESLGQIGVETVLAVLGGEEVESTVSVELALVTSESVLEFRGQDDDSGDN